MAALDLTKPCDGMITMIISHYFPRYRFEADRALGGHRTWYHAIALDLGTHPYSVTTGNPLDFSAHLERP